MRLADWVRAGLWRAGNWRAALDDFEKEVTSDHSSLAAERCFDLGQAFEHVEPDRKRALSMYVRAGRNGRVDAHDHARRIAHQVRAHDVISELAIADHERTGDPSHLVTAGIAWIDAGTPESAVEPLTRAVQATPSNAEATTLLAACKGELRDPRAEISRCAARANRTTTKEQARIYLYAARIAHAAKLDELYRRSLQMAYHARREAEVAALIEDRLLARSDATALLDFYRSRLETVRDDREWIELVRAAATRLVLATVQVGFALRLLRRGLEHAYTANLVEIPGHVASWHLLIDYAKRLRSTRELLPLVDEALALRLADDDRMFVATAGKQIAEESGDAAATQRHTAIVQTLVHELAGEAIVPAGADSTEPSVVIRWETSVPRVSTEQQLATAIAATVPLESVTSDAPPAPEIEVRSPDEAPIPTVPLGSATAGEVARPIEVPVLDEVPIPMTETLAPPPIAITRAVSDPEIEIIAASPEEPALASPSSPRPDEAPTPTTETPPPIAIARAVSDLEIEVIAASPEELALASPIAIARAVSDPEIEVIAASPEEPALASPPPLSPAPVATEFDPAVAVEPRLPPADPEVAAPKRRARRAVVPIDVELYLPTGNRVIALARDLSATGVFVATMQELELHMTVKLVMSLPGATVLDETRHEVMARVVRPAGAGYGMELVDPSPALIAAIGRMMAG